MDHCQPGAGLGSMLRPKVFVDDDACYSSSSSLFLVDHLQFMKKQQLDCVQVNYLFSPAAAITPDDRRALCSWCYRSVELFSNTNKATAGIAVSYLDRFMSTNSPRVADALQSRLQYQLVALACIVIALKCHAGVRVNFVDTICQGLYEKDEINACEIDILEALQWKLNGPSPHDFIDSLAGLLNECTIESTSSLSTWAKKYADAAVLDYEMAQNSSLTLAYSSLLTALQLKEMLFHPEDMITWISKLESISEGTRIDEIFILELEHIVHTNVSLSSLNNSETETSVVCNKNKRRISTAA
jgi:hypothetical protein